jgi:hypothetical protein
LVLDAARAFLQAFAPQRQFVGLSKLIAFTPEVSPLDRSYGVNKPG